MTNRDSMEAAWRLHSQGNLFEAEKLCREVLGRDQSDVSAWHLLGLIAYQVGKHEPAVECISRAIALNPTVAEMHSNLSLALVELRRYDEAAASCRRALQLKPAMAEAHNNLGNALKHAGQLDEAAAHYHQALRLKPSYAHAENNLGNVQYAQRRYQEAMESYGRALRLDPNFAQAYNNLGNVLKDLGKYEEACGHYQHAISLQPNYADAYSNLAVALEQLDRSEEAERCCRQAVTLTPESGVAHNNLGSVLRSLGKFDAAEAHCREALRLTPNFAEAMTNLGTVIEAQGAFEDAIDLYRRAIELNPQLLEAHTNLGNAERSLGRLEESIASCRRAIEISKQGGTAARPLGGETALPSDFQAANAHWNLALTLLLKGDYEQGWQEYEWRWKRSGKRPRYREKPRWDGGPLEGRTIMLWGEQGLGDTLQFIRYVEQVKQSGGRVMLECQRQLTRLLASYPHIDWLVARGDAAPDFDVEAPLMSLPGIMGTRLDTVPAEVPYLQAEPALVESWRRELARGPRFKVGIAWQGSREYRVDRFRSIPLATFAPLANVPEVQLYSLQKGEGVEQLAKIAEQFSVVDFGARLDEATGAFVDTAAIIKNLDLVITSDSAVAHLAGGLGVPVWLALSAVPDWRWLLAREDSPWYPTMRLFRQKTLGQWDDLFANMAEQLAELAK